MADISAAEPLTHAQSSIFKVRYECGFEGVDFDPNLDFAIKLGSRAGQPIF
jgi:hypothetical protein